ncbi:leucine dehydrogenase [bacterium]|nr:MAG: leucine dehydrogenase [bacterium]
MNDDILKISPSQFVSFLHEQGIHRAHFVWNANSGRVEASHPELEPIARFMDSDPRDFQQHEGVFLQVSREHDTLQGAFVHRTNRGQAAGGVRYWSYDTVEDYLRDGLRLAVGMTRKNALAGLWWGGGKGVMARNPQVDRDDRATRDSLYREYGELMTAVRGCYVTAEDAGTSVEDMAQVFATTRFTTCIPPELGGSGNPSLPTARGVLAGMIAALEFLDMGSIARRTFAVQGVGHVGGPLIGFLLEQGAARIFACDVDAALVRANRERFPDNVELRCVERDDTWIYAVDCDVFAPCATGAILNPATIPLLKARIVCGAANNQLEDAARDDALLHERRILYVPDFLTNRMGIVTCADESAGYVTPDPEIERHLQRDWQHSIHQTCMEVFGASGDSGRPTSEVATVIADRLSMEANPVYGHRGKRIIESLVADAWFRA